LVPLFPSAGDNVALQTGELGVNIANFGERGNALPNNGIQVRTWSFPIRTEKTVAAICGNGNSDGFKRPEDILKARDIWKNVPVSA
jgi:hypothetical protein